MPRLAVIWKKEFVRHHVKERLGNYLSTDSGGIPGSLPFLNPETDKIIS